MNSTEAPTTQQKIRLALMQSALALGDVERAECYATLASSKVVISVNHAEIIASMVHAPTTPNQRQAVSAFRVEIAKAVPR